LLVLCATAVLNLSASCFGGGDETSFQQGQPTTGQELIDLKAASDRGIVTRQYQQQKRLLQGA
jgi:hypothetical protein